MDAFSGYSHALFHQEVQVTQMAISPFANGIKAQDILPIINQEYPILNHKYRSINHKHLIINHQASKYLELPYQYLLVH